MDNLTQKPNPNSQAPYQAYHAEDTSSPSTQPSFHNMPDQPEQNFSEEQTKKPNYLPFIILFLAIITVAVGGSLYFYLAKKPSTQSSVPATEVKEKQPQKESFNDVLSLKEDMAKEFTKEKWGDDLYLTMIDGNICKTINNIYLHPLLTEFQTADKSKFDTCDNYIFYYESSTKLGNFGVIVSKTKDQIVSFIEVTPENLRKEYEANGVKYDPSNDESFKKKSPILKIDTVAYSFEDVFNVFMENGGTDYLKIIKEKGLSEVRLDNALRTDEQGKTVYSVLLSAVQKKADGTKTKAGLFIGGYIDPVSGKVIKITKVGY